MEKEKATSRQLGYIKGLAKRKGIVIDVDKMAALTKEQASEEITKLAEAEGQVVKAKAAVAKAKTRDIMVGLAVKLTAQQYIKLNKDFGMMSNKFRSDALANYNAMLEAEVHIRTFAKLWLQGGE